MLEFEYFLKIFQLCSVHGKNKFQAQKKDYIRQRREYLAANDDKNYERIVMEMTQKEEMFIQEKLMELIQKINMSEQDFQRNTMYHGQD